MSRFHRMVSLERTPEEKAEERIRDSYPPAISDMPDVPYGLCISLTEIELRKLGIDDDDRPEIGDMLHLFAMARVTSISQNDTNNGCHCRIELSITDMEVEDEDQEEPG